MNCNWTYYLGISRFIGLCLWVLSMFSYCFFLADFTVILTQPLSRKYSCIFLWCNRKYTDIEMKANTKLALGTKTHKKSWKKWVYCCSKILVVMLSVRWSFWTFTHCWHFGLDDLLYGDCPIYYRVFGSILASIH